MTRRCTASDTSAPQACQGKRSQASRDVTEGTTGLPAVKTAIQQTIVGRRRERKFALTVVNNRKTDRRTRRAVLVEVEDVESNRARGRGRRSEKGKEVGRSKSEVREGLSNSRSVQW